MAVAGYHCQAVGCQVEVDTVHHGAQLILCCSKYCTADVLCQHHVWDHDGRRILADGLGHGELVCIVDRQIEQSVLIRDLHDGLLLVHIEGDRLL